MPATRSSGERPRVSVPTDDDVQLEIGEAEIDASDLAPDLSAEQERRSLVDSMLEEGVAEMAAAAESSSHEHVEIDRSVRVEAPVSRSSGLQPAVRPGAAEQLAVPCAFRLTLTINGKAHNTITLDLSTRGLAALVRSSLPVNAPCEIVLHVAPEPIRAQARIASCAKYGSGSMSFRVSLDLALPVEAATAERLDSIVREAALRRANKKG
jgi:hypothetical protein